MSYGAHHFGCGLPKRFSPSNELNQIGVMEKNVALADGEYLLCFGDLIVATKRTYPKFKPQSRASAVPVQIRSEVELRCRTLRVYFLMCGRTRGERTAYYAEIFANITEYPTMFPQPSPFGTDMRMTHGAWSLVI